MRIILSNIQSYAFHGVLPQERTVGGLFSIELNLLISDEQACISDNLQDTVDYGSICKIVKQEMNIPSNLLEHVAARINQRLLKEYPLIDEIIIRITKHKPPIEYIDCSSATIELTTPRTRD